MTEPNFMVPAATKPILAFLRPGPHPYANTKLAETLIEQFPDYDVHVVDVVDRFRASRGQVALAAAAALRHYGVDIAKRKRNPKDALLRTPTAARLLRANALRAIAELPAKPAVTMQIQSLFDGHVDGVPHFVYTDHTHLANLQYRDFDPSRLYAASWIARERTIYEHATLVFVRSTHVARSLTADYSVDPSRVRLVYAGANAEDAAAAKKADPATSTQIVFVGIDWERKGGPTLLAAFTRLRARHPEATLVVVGCKLATPTPAGTSFLGKIPLSEVNGVLANSGVFCIPTTVEPFGIAFIEAMVCGLPVVSTTVGALPDIVENGISGLLIEPGDDVALEQALERMIADPGLRAKAGTRGAEIAAERYTWAGVGARMRAAMDETGAVGA